MTLWPNWLHLELLNATFNQNFILFYTSFRAVGTAPLRLAAGQHDLRMALLSSLFVTFPA